jgi:predicted nucleic acid-binding protein
MGGTLPVTHHGRVEVINAISLAVFRGELEPKKSLECQSWFSDDFIQGQLAQVDILWRAALNRAAELAQAQSPKLGTRTLDVLHVACALELRMRHFLSFDERQKKLAVVAGLKVIRL